MRVERGGGLEVEMSIECFSIVAYACRHQNEVLEFGLLYYHLLHHHLLPSYLQVGSEDWQTYFQVPCFVPFHQPQVHHFLHYLPQNLHYQHLCHDLELCCYSSIYHLDDLHYHYPCYYEDETNCQLFSQFQNPKDIFDQEEEQLRERERK